MMSSTLGGPSIHDVVGVGQRGNVAVQGRLGLAENGERRRGIPRDVPVEGAALGIDLPTPPFRLRNPVIMTAIGGFTLV